LYYRVVTVGNFDQLLDRAARHLRAAGIALSASDLAQAIVGASPVNSSPFGRLLTQALAADPRFTPDSQGRWQLATTVTPVLGPDEQRSTASTALPKEVVVVHLETTGGMGERPRLLDVAAIRLCDGKSEDTFASLVRPPARVSRYVLSRLGLDPEELETAPAPEHVLAGLTAFVGDAVVVGHNVRFLIGQLNYEALWHGLAGFENTTLDLQALAMRALPQLKRPSLANVAQLLGVPIPRSGRAAAIAGLASKVLASLGCRVSQHGEASSDHAIVQSAQIAGSMRYLRRLPPGAGTSLPGAPGVYLFLDAEGRVLYIGKASNLRHRVAQHFTGAARASRLDDGLLVRVASVEHRLTGSELEALWLESRLIREFCPTYNAQTRSHLGKPFIRIESGPFPRITTASAIDEVGEFYGPYRNGHAANRMVRAIRKIFQIRTCLRQLPARRRKMREPCLRLGQNLCPAPCADLVSREQYAILVELARVFLAQGRDSALEAVDARLRDLTGADEAACLAAGILEVMRARLAGLEREERPLPGGLSGGRLAMVYPDANGDPTLYLIRNGRLLARRVFSGTGGTLDAGSLVAQAIQQQDTWDSSDSLLDTDQTNILLRWICQHSANQETIAVDS
jgi:DNA polymerase III subunit epsilon